MIRIDPSNFVRMESNSNTTLSKQKRPNSRDIL